MMLSGVLTKTFRDRWSAFAIGAIAIGVLLIFGMAVYRNIDLDIYRSLPEAFGALIGIGPDTDAAGLAYGAMYGLMGAFTLAGLALWVGSGSIAGEESAGTMAVLLGNPKSRSHILASKAAAMVVLTVFGGLILAGAAFLGPALLDVAIGGMDPGALVIHMTVSALFYGFLALAIGAWTGNGGLAAGLSAGLMVLGYFAVGLLPLLEGFADLARVFPWYYFDGSSPELNGIEWTHLIVLAVASVALAGAAFVGVNRRDLRSRSIGRTMTDRLRSSPVTRIVAERLAGSAAVSRIWTRTASEYQGLVLILGAIMVAMGAMMGPMYSLIPVEVRDFTKDLPAELLAIVGGGDMTTVEGWYQLENFSLTAPIVMLLLTIVVGARALAGEEGMRTIGLLLANPVPRSRIVLEKTLAMLVLAVAVGFATFLGTVIGFTVGGHAVEIGNIAAISALVTLLGLTFGGLALFLGAATGRVSVAVQGAVGVALVAFVTNSFLPLSTSLAEWARLSPFYYYLTSNPLMSGLDWSHAVVLAAVFAVLVVASVPVFDRRDLRQNT